MKVSSFFSVEIPARVDLNLMMRALAVVSVIYWHINGYQAAGCLEQLFTVSGRFSVWVFFCLSGYLIGLSLLSNYTLTAKGVLSFYRNRFLRILPIFFFVSLIMLVYKCLFLNPAMDLRLFNPGRELLMLQYEHSYSLNGVFWTLGIEIQFYLIAPLLIFLFRRGQIAKSCILIGFVIVILLISNELWDITHWTRRDSRSLFGNLVHFLVGIMIAFLYPVIRKKSELFKLKHIVFLCITALLIVQFTNFLYFNALFLFLGCIGVLLTDSFVVLILIVHIAFETRKVIANKYLSLALGLGTLSYGIYAWHGVVSIFNGVYREMFLINLLVSTILAYLSYIVIEKPMRKYRAKNVAQSSSFFLLREKIWG